MGYEGVCLPVDEQCVVTRQKEVLGSNKSTVLPEYTSYCTLASTINMFFY